MTDSAWEWEGWLLEEATEKSMGERPRMAVLKKTKIKNKQTKKPQKTQKEGNPSCETASEL